MDNLVNLILGTLTTETTQYYDVFYFSAHCLAYVSVIVILVLLFCIVKDMFKVVR